MLFIVGMPDVFYPAIGRVIVSHAFADGKLNDAINFHSGMDGAAGIAVLAPVTSTADRAKMLKYLARVKSKTASEYCKYHVLAHLITDLSELRNKVAHNIPYAWSSREIMYVKKTNLTMPQITKEEIERFTLQRLANIALELHKVGVWLGIALPGVFPDGFSPAGKSFEEIRAILLENAGTHPEWLNDDAFPWQAKFKARMKEESKVAAKAAATAPNTEA